MIFIDSNIPMYLVGADETHRLAAQRALERFITGREKLVTNAEVFQEILHRYTAIGRRDAIQPAFDALAGVVDEVLDIGRRDVVRAKDILQNRPHLSARDALHLATMERHRVDQVLSFDAGFDQVPGITRIAG